MRRLDTPNENTWCKGCGNFGILAAFKNTVTQLDSEGMSAGNIVITCGIGCHGKIFDYINLSGFYGLHGRAVALAQGIKLANPALRVVCFSGDGDSMSEGLEHILFAAKRNMDITVILHNNGVYGLTTGQFSPVMAPGYKGLSTPFGSIESPFAVQPLLMEAGATFLARTYSVKLDHMQEMIHRAIVHQGFAVVEVLQPCVSYNNTYTFYNEKTSLLTDIPTDEETARRLAKSADPIHLGIFRQEDKPTYHELLYGDHNPHLERRSDHERIALLKSIFDRG